MADSNKRQYYEYIVIGCGGIGSGAVYWLSKRSKSVLGLEQFCLGHENGGSQDHSRIIRLAYHDDSYIKLTPETFKAWEQIEKESGLQVWWKTGCVRLARKGQTDYVLENYAAAMDRNRIRYHRLNNKQLMARYPQFTVGPDIVSLYQEYAGLVDAAKGNAVHIQLARGNGATILENCPATRITRANNGNVVVHTTKGVFECRKVMVTAGGWLNTVLGSIGVHIPVTVTQEQVTYYASPHMKLFTKDKFPIWTFHLPQYNIYALPIHGNTGTKIGVDAGGHVVTADTRTFNPDPVRVKSCTDLLNEICPKFSSYVLAQETRTAIPALEWFGKIVLSRISNWKFWKGRSFQMEMAFVGPILQTKTCLYTMTPDRNFVVDTCAHKGWSNVIVCCGAGHAYKFASFLGKVLSEMAIDGRTQYDISQFNITRDAIQDPSFKPNFLLGRDIAAKL